MAIRSKIIPLYGHTTETRASPSAINITPSVAASEYVAAIPSNPANAEVWIMRRNIWVSPATTTQHRVVTTMAGRSQENCDEDHTTDDLGRISIRLPDWSPHTNRRPA
jgi:hypothetical protein